MEEYKIINEKHHYNSALNKIKNLSNLSKGTVKIILKDDLASGCFLKFKRNKRTFFCLITNQHVITSEMVDKEEEITIKYDNDEKTAKIKLNRNKRIIVCFKEFYNLDVTIVQIIKDDNLIEQNNYFLTPNMDYSSPFEKYKGKNIQVVQFPRGGDLSYSEGKILGTDLNNLFHNASTEEGSSGSPIVFKGEEKVIAIHKGAIKNQNKNIGIFIKDIVEIMKDFSKKWNQNKNYNTNFNNITFSNIKIGICKIADFLHPIVNVFGLECTKCEHKTEIHDKIEDGIWYCQECDGICELTTNKFL